MRHDGVTHLGRIAARPERGGDDVSELDLVHAGERPPVDAATSDERSGGVAEHPDPEAVVAPVPEPALEEFPRLLRRQRLGAERRQHQRVAMRRGEVVVVVGAERAAVATRCRERQLVYVVRTGDRLIFATGESATELRFRAKLLKDRVRVAGGTIESVTGVTLTPVRAYRWQ